MHVAIQKGGYCEFNVDYSKLPAISLLRVCFHLFHFVCVYVCVLLYFLFIAPIPSFTFEVILVMQASLLSIFLTNSSYLFISQWLVGFRLNRNFIFLIWGQIRNKREYFISGKIWSQDLLYFVFEYREKDLRNGKRVILVFLDCWLGYTSILILVKQFLVLPVSYSFKHPFGIHVFCSLLSILQKQIPLQLLLNCYI